MTQDFKQIRIRKNHRMLMPETVLYFDTETRYRTIPPEQHHRMDMAWSCLASYDRTGRPQADTWHYHNDPHELCRYFQACFDQYKGIYIIGHNVFFDLQVSDFFYWFTKWGYRLDFYYESGLTYILVITKSKRYMKALSSTNWYDTNLRGLGDTIGLEKLDVDFEHDDRETIIEYCKRDVEIVKKAMEHYFAFVFDHNLGQFSITKASQAYHAYRHRFMNIPIYVHQDDTVRGLERDAYYGGRVECFQIGKVKKGPFLYLDINSMYPFVMKNKAVPTKLVEYHTRYDLKKLEYLLDVYCAVAEVTLKTNEPAYAVRHNNKICFPVGTFDTFLCTDGLRYAIEYGHLKDAKQVAIYRGGHIFKEYVDFFYPLKEHYTKTGEKVLRELVKKMLNSLYGKFAQRQPIVNETVEETFDGYYREEIYNLVTGERGVLYKMFNTLVEQYGYEETTQTFTAISAHITESARFLLWSIIKDVGINRCLYCDTDSLIIRESDMDRIIYPIDDTALGALAIEKTVNDLEIYGPKSYIMDGRRKLKGVPKSAEKIDDRTFKYFTWYRQANHMKRETDRWYILRETIKRVKSEYDKGVVLKNGRVKPFRFPLVSDDSDPLQPVLAADPAR